MNKHLRFVFFAVLLFLILSIYFIAIIQVDQNGSFSTSYFNNGNNTILNNLQTEQKHIILNKYVDKLSLLIANGSLNHNNNSAIIINNLKFRPISKTLILENLGNKSILIFGDSLGFYLSSYIVQIIYICLEKTESKLRNGVLTSCPTFCDNFNQEISNNINFSLILNECERRIISNRQNMGYIMGNNKTNFTKYPKGLNDPHAWKKNSIHFLKYNISIYLYYNHGHYLNKTNPSLNLLNDMKYFNNKYDIIINNMLATHWTINQNNIPFLINMILNEEFEIKKFIKYRTKDSCLILGPINPHFEINERMDASPYSPYIIKDDIILLNITNNTKRKRLYSLCLSKINNYNNYKMDINQTDIEYICKLEAMDVEKYKMIAQKMKQIVNKLSIKNVFYHNQYQLYWSLKNLKNYSYQWVHFPPLTPISWTNLLNIIQHGCN